MERILKDGAALGLTLAFVWNRDLAKLRGLVPDELILQDLSSFANRYMRAHARAHAHLCIMNMHACPWVWQEV